MTSTQVINNVRQQLKLKEVANNKARMSAHKVELTAKSNQIAHMNHFIVNTIVTH